MEWGGKDETKNFPSIIFILFWPLNVNILHIEKLKLNQNGKKILQPEIEHKQKQINLPGYPVKNITVLRDCIMLKYFRTLTLYIFNGSILPIKLYSEDKMSFIM